MDTSSILRFEGQNTSLNCCLHLDNLIKFNRQRYFMGKSQYMSVLTAIPACFSGYLVAFGCNLFWVVSFKMAVVSCVMIDKIRIYQRSDNSSELEK